MGKDRKAELEESCAVAGCTNGAWCRLAEFSDGWLCAFHAISAIGTRVLELEDLVKKSRGWIGTLENKIDSRDETAQLKKRLEQIRKLCE